MINIVSSPDKNFNFDSSFDSSVIFIEPSEISGILPEEKLHSLIWSTVILSVSLVMLSDFDSLTEIFVSFSNTEVDSHDSRSSLSLLTLLISSATSLTFSHKINIWIKDFIIIRYSFDINVRLMRCIWCIQLFCENPFSLVTNSNALLSAQISSEFPPLVKKSCEDVSSTSEEFLSKKEIWFWVSIFMHDDDPESLISASLLSLFLILATLDELDDLLPTCKIAFRKDFLD
ncbi:hypothetical protein Anas_11805 [Armadillidium nasatum]|uniref:Uncharacterized protein n=1 Tax=Armadillidium nasatum TaxID=96803 RepID=A0A5N5T183_9CRUS|nr:hypothetical protein Anas_11805 [Armadillidium nasatum]